MKVLDLMADGKKPALIIVGGDGVEIEIQCEEDEDEVYAWEHAMVDATRRGSHLFRVLDAHELPEIGTGSELLDLVGSHLAEKELLFEPGELMCSAESTLANSGSDAIYFLNVDPCGVPEDYALICDRPTVADSLARSRLGLSKWEGLPPIDDIHWEQAPSAWTNNYRQIAQFLGRSHREIAAANLIFARSKRFRPLKTRWEQVADCLPAHQLIVDAIQPGLLWVTGENFDIQKWLSMLAEIEWRKSDKSGFQFGRGRIEFCGRWMDFAFTPALSSWSSSDEGYRELLDWTFPGRAAYCHDARSR